MGESAECLLKVRQTKSRILVDAIKSKLDELKTILPQSSLGKAVSYTQDLWQGQGVFLENPDVHFHTNDIERAIKSPVIGRKNHYGSHSLRSAEVASTWYSIVAGISRQKLINKMVDEVALTPPEERVLRYVIRNESSRRTYISAHISRPRP